MFHNFQTLIGSPEYKQFFDFLILVILAEILHIKKSKKKSSSKNASKNKSEIDHLSGTIFQYS